MEAQLQHGVDVAAALALELFERVEVPGVQDERLFADGVGADAQREADVRVVQVVGRADADVVDAAVLGAAAQLVDVAIEALELGEEGGVGPESIEDADRVVRIDGGDEAAADVLDGLEVPSARRWRS